MKEIKFLDIEKIKVGHCENHKGGTGCTVVLCEEGATGGVAVRGGAPGTRETDLLNPTEMIEKIHAVVLSGGSAFGLDASCGVMEYLESKNIGFDVGVTKVPIVCSAVLFDLTIGDSKIRPDKKMGYEACVFSETNTRDLNGNVGAGCGATIGKVLGPNFSMKSGLGSYAIQIGDLKIGAMVAVNAFGDVIDPSTGEILAGVLDYKKLNFLNTEDVLIKEYENKNNRFNGNTTIGLIVTNAILSKSETNKIASIAHNGFAKTIYPVHTMYDGDTIFAMATNIVKADVSTVGMLASKVMEKAVINAIENAESSYGLLSRNEFLKKKNL
ncbi:P1 family peptidase [Clostridium sp. ATCC 25772]|uniref:P1 family peptidase n=1 Tax=Clostridium sp. ATCC 25772 TaxID=1676991 RepID=UPI000783C63C|nr:P1 family peptidase [Clostridium sp. ATCC 25772]